MNRLITLFMLCAGGALAATTTNIVVQVSADGLQTVPPNTIALPAQVSEIESVSGEAKSVAEAAQAKADACETKVGLFSSNYVVTSTVYVQSIGAIAFDPSNQTVTVHSFTVSDTNIVLIGTVRQLPLVTPVLDWRQTLGTGGVWSNIAATVVQVDVPSGATNAAAAYLYTLPRPSGGSAIFRIVDNSTGAGGSGLFWVVFGGITVDGHKGANGVITNVVGSVTNFYRKVGGIIVDPEPLGEM